MTLVHTLVYAALVVSVYCEKQAEGTANDIYFGIPLGTIRLEEYNLAADVYASDEYTITMQNFTYQPLTEGCVSLIVGPPRENERKSLKEGVLLEMFEARISPGISTRRTRQALNNNVFPLSQWIAELDHLEMPPDANKPLAKQPDPFAGIQLDVGQQPGIPKNSKEILIGDTKDSDDVDAENSQKQNAQGTTDAGESEQSNFFEGSGEILNDDHSKTEVLHIEIIEKTKASKMQTLTTTVSPKKKPKKVPDLFAKKQPKSQTLGLKSKAELKSTKTNSSQKPKEANLMKVERKTLTGGQEIQTKAPPFTGTTIKPLRSTEELTVRAERTKETMVVTMRMKPDVIPQKGAKQQKTSVFILPSTTTRNSNIQNEEKIVSKKKPNSSKGLVVEEPIDEADFVHFEHLESENDYHQDLVVENPPQKPLNNRQRAHSGIQGPGLVVINPDTGKVYDKDLAERKKLERIQGYEAQKAFKLMKNSPNRTSPETKRPKPSGSIMFAHHEETNASEVEQILSEKFFEDAEIVPVSTTVSYLLQPQPTTILRSLAKKTLVEEKDQKKKKDPIKSKKKTIESTVQSKVESRPTLDKKYILPRKAHGSADFVLTNGATLTGFKWIGVYDNCKRNVIPVITIDNIDPPRVERLSPFRHRSHRVKSRRVQILNCNTVLVPQFSYDSKTAPKGTYFYFGVGHVPDNIKEKIRAIVVGEPSDTPLRSFSHEDVLLRLPKGYRTFDVDFLTVFNDYENRSYGHVVVPSLLVPPCSEEDL